MVARSVLDPKILLAELLRSARQQSRYRTQEALAEAIGKERTAIGKPEQGERVPAVDVLDDVLTSCEVTGLARQAIEGVWQLARRWEDPAAARVAPWYEIEARAHTLRYWAPLLVPGPFQTPAYAEEIFRGGGFDEAKVKTSLETRLRRQDILIQDRPPDITIVLWEPVLHHEIGSPEVMRGQLSRLLELSEAPNVSLHVLPPGNGANPGLGGAIQLAAADDEPEALLSDALLEDSLSQEPETVHRARSTFSRVRADSLNQTDTRQVISEALETWSR